MMQRMQRNVTIRDVAKVAGVSKSTVSLVLQDSPKVAPKTRERVWQALRETGYVPNAAARTLVQGRTRVIGLATANFNQKLTERLYFSSIMGALFSTLAKQEYHLMIYNAALPLQLSVDGMLFISVNMDHHLVSDVQRAGLPYTFINRRTDDPNVPFVSNDFIAGGRMATEHLIQLGHRRIAILTGDVHAPPHRDRLQGYQEAMERAFGPEAPLIISATRDLTPAYGYQGASTLFNREDPPTAIFVSNYELLPGLLDYCRTYGITIPNDLSVICFDDPWAVSAMDPPMTVVHTASDEVGRMAANLIVDLVEGRTPHQTQMYVLPQLVIRSSTMPCVVA